MLFRMTWIHAKGPNLHALNLIIKNMKKKKIKIDRSSLSFWIRTVEEENIKIKKKILKALDVFDRKWEKIIIKI